MEKKNYIYYLLYQQKTFDKYGIARTSIEETKICWSKPIETLKDILKIEKTLQLCKDTICNIINYTLLNNRREYNDRIAERTY